MNKIVALTVAAALIICGILAELNRPRCDEFDQSQRPYWSQTDYEIYANCK